MNNNVPSAPSGQFRNGLLLAALSALAYSVSNLALRSLSAADEGGGWELWVTAMKAVPTAFVAWSLVARRVIRRESAFPPRHMLPMLIAAALLMQVGGNLCFQVALGYIGLGISVPLVFSGILLVGALLGRVLLNDGLGPHLIASMGMMLVAICLLSAGTFSGDGTGPERTAELRIDYWRVVTGIAIALISGCSYGAIGVLIRRVVRETLPVESTLIVFSSCGVLLLAPAAIYLSGWESIQTGTIREWPYLLAAGFTNALAFFAITHAFRFINVNTINVINASQNAMCAMGAVLIFGEHLGVAAVTGIALTGLGLVTAARSKS